MPVLMGMYCRMDGTYSREEATVRTLRKRV
jgi:hypothetical protein